MKPLSLSLPRSLLGFLPLTLMLLLTSCEKENELPCGLIDPLNELEWMEGLKQSVDESCDAVQLSLFQARYKRKTVFILQVTDPRVNTVFSVSLLNCGGELIKTFGPDDHEEFYRKVTEREVLYSCSSGF